MDSSQTTISCSSTSPQARTRTTIATASPLTNHQIKGETKLCIIIDSSTPIILKVPIAPENFTLGQFKAAASLQQDCYKFYFKSLDSEFGIVKEEIVDDDSLLPVDGDRIVAWVISNSTNHSTLFESENPYERLNGTYVTETSNSVTSKASQSPLNLRPNNSIDYASEGRQSSILYAVNVLLDNYNFLGLTLVGPGDDISSTDRGIYVGEISRDSVVEHDGRIEVGDKIVEINGYDLTDMNNDDAVNTFRCCINRRGAINLILQRNLNTSSYNGNNKGRFTLPREYANGINHHYTSPKPPEPHCHRHLRTNKEVSPIPVPDYSSSSQHLKNGHKPETPRTDLKNIRGETHSLPRSVTPRSFYAINNFDNFPANNFSPRLDSRSVYEPTTPTSLRQCEVVLHCGKDSIHIIYAALRSDAKSLDIKDRDWLKVVIKNAFLGSNLVKWLSRNVYGFSHRREIKQYANQMLELGLIKNPMSSRSFSEKCYYTLS